MSAYTRAFWGGDVGVSSAVDCAILVSMDERRSIGPSMVAD